MKAINIKNIVIQFDGNGKNLTKEASAVIDLINKTLQEADLTCQPQIMVGEVKASNVSVVDDEE